VANKLSPVFNDAQFIDGIPAVGAKVFTYQAGSTTPLTTYSNEAGSAPNPNPVILNARGEPPQPFWLIEGQSYKFVFTSSTDTDPPDSPIRTLDNIIGVGDNMITVSQWQSVGVTPTYINATTFTVAGDQTGIFTVGLRVKLNVTAGTVYGTITNAVYNGISLTTVTVQLDSGALDSGLSSVQIGLITPDNTSLPANIDNTFDARVKQSGRIELDGAPFKYGKWRLDRVQVKQGRPYAYTLTFWGNLVSLKDKFKNDELKDLDFSAFNHAYTSANVKTGLTSSLFGGDLVYNLFSKKQLYYNSVGSDNTQTDILANIAWGGGANAGIKYDELRPSIRLLPIIEAIEAKYNVIFSRDFFSRVEFTNLFLWVNNDKDLINVTNKFVRIDMTNSGTIGANGGIINTVEDTFTPGGKRIYGEIRIFPSPGYENVIYSVERRLNGESWGTVSNIKGNTVTQWRIDNDGKKHSWYVYANEEFKFTSSLTIEFYYESYNGVASFPEQTISGNFDVALNMPKIKVIDFMNGLFKAFKLVVIANEFDDIYVNTLKDYYASGRVWNVSKYIKTDSTEVSRGTLLNEINFKFTEPTTLLNTQFTTNTGAPYGDENILLTEDGTSTGIPLDGDSLDFSVPFEQIVYERLIDLNGNTQTNIMYGGIFDETISPVNPKAHIFYNILTPVLSNPIGFIDELNAKSIINTNTNVMSHSIDFENPDYNFVFGIENNEWTNIASETTLYFNYHKDYVESIFNVKRRTFKFEGIFPLRILLQLQLNDVLEINHNYYRIDNYTLELTKQNISLSLINSFDNTIAGFNSNVYAIYADFQAQEQSVYVTNLGNFSLNISSGTWLTWYNVDNNIFFVFEENNTGQTRTTDVTITNTDTLQVIDIFVQQKPRIITSDNNIIKSDNDIITSDNG